jgi:hypothetical protein
MNNYTYDNSKRQASCNTTKISNARHIQNLPGTTKISELFDNRE